MGNVQHMPELILSGWMKPVNDSCPRARHFGVDGKLLMELSGNNFIARTLRLASEESLSKRQT